MPTRVPVARHGWSGAHHLAIDANPVELSRLIGLLPKRKSPYLVLKEKLRYFGAQFQRYLHQDEFGPARVDQAAALQSFLEIIRKSEYSSDYPPLEALAEYLDALDTNASGVLLMKACELGLDLTRLRDSCTALVAVRKLELLESAVRATIEHLRKPGPISQESMNIFVFQLSEIWQQETDSEPTGRTSNSETPFEHFVQTAVDIFKPNDDWLQERAIFSQSVRAQKFAIDTMRYRPSVRQAIRKIRQRPDRDPGRPHRIG